MWKRVCDVAIAVTGITAVIYHLTYSQYLLQGPKEHRIVHLGLGLLLLFLSALRTGGRYWVPKLGLVVTSIIIFTYLRLDYPRLELYGMLQATNVDIAVGVILIFLCLEATRRAFGLVLPIVSIMAILYMWLGSYLPPGLLHALPQKLPIVIEILSVGFAECGVFGPILGISATFIFLFMVFGALVQISGATEFFNQVGNLVGQKMRSSAAMAAIVTSGLVGSVSGQAGPNVMITGSFTIPAMKKLGYKPEQAGGIEAAASTGGPIIPPVMGVAAFLMADVTGIPYAKIIGVAVLPALFYVFSGALYVEFQAARMNLSRFDIQVNYRELLFRAPLFLAPLGVIIALFSMGYTPLFVSFWACITTVTLGLLRRQTRPSLKALVDGLVKGASWGAAIGASCATLGLVVGALTNSGLGVKLPSALGSLAGENLLFLLILTGLASLILGIGMPASAAYLLVAIVLAPVLTAKGVPILSAHLFSFYLANFSYVTPPVALAALFAARLAGGNFLRTALESMKVGIGGFILPFMIVWVGAFTWDFSNPLFAVTAVSSCVVTFIGLQSALVGYLVNKLSLAERLLLGLSPFCLMSYLASKNLTWLIIGSGMLLIMYLWQRHKKKLAGLKSMLSKT